MNKALTQRLGFTLIETLVGIAIFGILFLALVMIIDTILKNIAESQIRTTAISLAQTKMETIRNLSYNQVGTTGGIPQGTIAPTEIITINSLLFTIKTSIIYLDDEFDGLAPNDAINTDYKRVRVEVTWGGAYPSRLPVTFVTNIVPKGIETIVGGGTLLLKVFDSSSQPVSNAVVNIDNSNFIPEIHMQTLTNNNGLVILPGTPVCNTCFKITVSKEGFSTDKTYATSEVANPLQPYLTVIENQTTQATFSIDRVSSISFISVGSRESDYPRVANVQFTLKGNKTIGYDTFDEPVLKFSQNLNTGGSTINVPDLETDTYNLDFTNSSHNLAGSIPINPLILLPNTSLTDTFVAVPKTNTSLLLVIQNTAQNLLASASAKLTNTQTNFDQTKTTGATGSADFAQVFFGGLNYGTTYNLAVNSTGYQEATNSFTLTGINQQIITLIQNQ